MTMDQAVDYALGQAMAEDHRVLTWGEDVQLLRRDLFARFGPDRVTDTPISESAFLYAGVGAAMAGLKPVVELYMIDFAAVGWSAIVNAAAMFPDFSGQGRQVPLIVRAGCGGWYSDGGQHEQVLWGSLAAHPGAQVLVPSTPADAAALLMGALASDRFSILLTPKLLDAQMLDYLAGATRPTVDFGDVIPAAGARGEVPQRIEPLPIGRATERRAGSDVVLVSVGVGVHRCLEAADALAAEGVEASVLDLRCVAPLDRDAIVERATATGRLVVVDEDYIAGGLSGEVAAALLEAGVPASYARVAVDRTLPFAPHLERAALPNVERITAAARALE